MNTHSWQYRGVFPFSFGALCDVFTACEGILVTITKNKFSLEGMFQSFYYNMKHFSNYTEVYTVPKESK